VLLSIAGVLTLSSCEPEHIQHPLEDRSTTLTAVGNIPPTVMLAYPIGEGQDKFITLICDSLATRWIGHDEDGSGPDQLPVGYQLKLIRLPVITHPDEAVIQLLESTSSSVPNLLIPEGLVVADSVEVTDETYHAADWWPKVFDPYPDDRFLLDALGLGDYAMAVRAVDEDTLVTPYGAFAVSGPETDGNIVKFHGAILDTALATLTVRERYSERSWSFTDDTQRVPLQVPTDVPYRFGFAGIPGPHCGRELIPEYNYAIDIPDPDCGDCEAPDGIGGWAGWSDATEIPFDLIFTEEDGGEEHWLYVKLRNADDPTLWEIRGSFVLTILAPGFQRPALWVDDFKIAGIDDCEHDAIIGSILDYAVRPYLRAQEGVAQWAAHNPTGPTGCQESSAPRDPPALEDLLRFRLLFWNVAPAGLGSALGSVTQNPAYPGGETSERLASYVQAGGSVVVWGTQTIGTLLGDFYPGEPWTPELPQFPDGNFGPGTFVWDVMQFRTQFDYTGRGVNRQLQSRCSGIIGYEATQLAIDEGYPVGMPDPTGYDPSRSAIWFDAWQGMRNPGGGNLAVGMRGQPALAVAGLDTLYNFVTNSWSYAQIDPGDNYPSTAQPDPDAHCPTCIREACGTSFPSPFEGNPVIVRYESPVPGHGKIVWIGAPFYYFAANHTEDLKEIMRKLADWILSE
jgi:hypothetical protein